MRMLRLTPSLATASRTATGAVQRRVLTTTALRAQEGHFQRNPSAAPPPQNSIWNNLLLRSKTPEIDLTTPFPGLPDVSERGAEPSVEEKVELTTLPSGLRVASIQVVSPIASIGVFVDAGSRYENTENNGISHFLELMAFKSTENRSDFKLVRDMLRIGANISATSSREHLIYNVDALQQHVPAALDALADVIQNTAFMPDEVLSTQERYVEEYNDKYEHSDVKIMEAIHEAAYKNESLGLPLYPPKENVQYFTPVALKEYVRTFFTPKRIVISGVGIEHDHLVKLSQQLFQNLPADTQVSKQPAKYSGGEIRMHKRGGGDPLTHVAVAFETANWHSKDLVPMCVLTQLMGGGGSFSAGGPGKGMYSRLYTNVLNQNEWVESATCFNSIFDDSGLLGFYGTSQPESADKLVNVLVKEAKRMAGPVDSQELTRAKNQLKSAILMQLEQRTLKLEDIGRQVVVYGKVVSANELCQQVDAVRAEDIQRVAKALLATNPSVAALGDCSKIPRYDEIQKAFK